jgi:pyruvate kinase
MRRSRNAKIVATLGPASSSEDMMRQLFLAGVDVFRMNFSHGDVDGHRERFALLRKLEKEMGRPIGILADLQGPKLRIGTFVDGPVMLEKGQPLRLELRSTPGDARCASLPHPEVFAALRPGTALLLDDGKLRLVVESCGDGFAETRVTVGGKLSERKGINVPDAVLPIGALTEKDKRDLDVALELGADWIALSFVQRPEDILEARERIGKRALVMTKLEKPAAIEQLDEIVALSDGVMVARGDLGVEMPAERVPSIQKRIVKTCRRLGRPVIVATQMLESMIDSPVPTRAEASDVATAIYDGADAVMLSAESATGKHPVGAVDVMDRIIRQVESDPLQRQLVDASHVAASPSSDVADAVCCAVRRTVSLLQAKAIVSYTSSGHTSLRMARERPESPILSLTPNIETARRLTLAWGVHSVHIQEVSSVGEMTDLACASARSEGFAEAGQTIVAIAGMPFGTSGTTNLMRIATV